MPKNERRNFSSFSQVGSMESSQPTRSFRQQIKYPPQSIGFVATSEPINHAQPRYLLIAGLRLMQLWNFRIFFICCKLDCNLRSECLLIIGHQSDRLINNQQNQEFAFIGARSKSQQIDPEIVEKTTPGVRSALYRAHP